MLECEVKGDLFLRNRLSRCASLDFTSIPCRTLFQRFEWPNVAFVIPSSWTPFFSRSTLSHPHTHSELENLSFLGGRTKKKKLNERSWVKKMSYLNGAALRTLSGPPIGRLWLGVEGSPRNSENAIGCTVIIEDDKCPFAQSGLCWTRSPEVDL